MSLFEEILQRAEEDRAARRDDVELPPHAGKYGKWGPQRRPTEWYAVLSIQHGRLVWSTQGYDPEVYRKPEVWTPMPEIRCRTCGEIKPATAANFPRDARYRGGFDRRCRTCEAKRQRRNRRNANRTVKFAG